MTTIPDSAKTLIETWRLGFVATADAEGRPNVSPKGTFAVIDGQTLGFAEMRSPQTVANIEARPDVEVNFVDILTRKGVRLRGTAKVVKRGTDAFATHLPIFVKEWADLKEMFNAIVVITVSECRPLASPAYEAGADEAALRETWLAKIQEAAEL